PLHQDNDAVPDRVLGRLADGLGQPQQQEVAIAPDLVASGRRDAVPSTGYTIAWRGDHASRLFSRAGVAWHAPSRRRSTDRPPPLAREMPSAAARTGCAAAR